jgi:hypothetical protein
VALLAPVTMIAALVVLALGGGFGGLGALAQLVSGPAVPVGSTLGAAAAGGSAKHRTAPLVLPVVPTAPAAAPAGTRVAATSPAPPVRPSGGGTPARGGSGQRVSSGGGHGAPTAGAPGKTGPPPPTAPPTSAPTPTPTPAPAPVAPLPALVNGVVGVGVSVTSKLPGPLGTLGTGILQSLGQTLDQLLTPPS